MLKTISDMAPNPSANKALPRLGKNQCIPFGFVSLKRILGIGRSDLPD